MEFAVSGDSAPEFFPVIVSFTCTKPFCPIAVLIAFSLIFSLNRSPLLETMQLSLIRTNTLSPLRTIASSETSNKLALLDA